MPAQITSGLADGQPPLDPLDGLTQADAHRLAARIVEFWASRGHAVTVRVERDTGARRTGWVVRSDLFSRKTPSTASTPGGQP